MKMKTAELIGAPLDWAVAQCEGVEVWTATGNSYPHQLRVAGQSSKNYTPSSDWAQGGPIVDRIGLLFIGTPGRYQSWIADKTDFGPRSATHLVAAMRCYAAFKLGKEVDVPEGLLP